MVHIKKTKNKGKEYLSLCESKRVNGKVVNRHIKYLGVVPIIGNENTSKKDKKLIRNAQIIDRIIKGKSKEDLAYLYGVTKKTIENIWNKYSEHGSESLIHTRMSKDKIVDITSSEQAAIITDFVKNPTKDAKEIKKTNNAKSTIKDIKKMILPIAEALKLKKKIKLRVENIIMEIV